jgi:hypothetical protein
MTRLEPIRLLLCALVLAFAPGASAQVHQHADTTRAEHHDGMMDHGGMMSMEQMEAMMPQMMRMHERMMADSVIHRRMMADPEMHAMMQEVMGGEMAMGAMRERMAALSPDERRAAMEQMHDRMMARMEAMPPAERRAMMHRMMEAHRRLVADPAVHERMMADPEMRQMMDGMHGGDTMDHDGMRHDGMRHDGMEGMDHGQTDGMGRERVEPPQMAPDDVRAAEAASHTADRFHAALAAGDRAAAEALLLPDAVVLEGGEAEARAEYLGHHFGADAAFLAALTREPLHRRTGVAGEAAWVATTSRLHGTYEGRALDLDSAELLVLRRDASAPDGWRVAAVHWSSGARD